MTREESYKKILRDCGLREEEFLRIYNLNDEDCRNELKKLSESQQQRFPHLFVAYRQLLREHGQFESK